MTGVNGISPRNHSPTAAERTPRGADDDVRLNSPPDLRSRPPVEPVSKNQDATPSAVQGESLKPPDHEETATAAATASPQQRGTAKRSVSKTLEEMRAELPALNDRVKQLFERIEESSGQYADSNVTKLRNDCTLLVDQVEKLTAQVQSLQKNNGKTSAASPGKLKVLASSVKNMFKSLGVVTTGGMMVLGGIGLMGAILSCQFYAVPVLFTMTAIGYIGVSMFLENEQHEEHARHEHMNPNPSMTPNPSGRSNPSASATTPHAA